MGQRTTSDLHSAFPKLYRSLDLRIAGIKVDDTWVNLVTVIRWRYEELSEVLGIQEHLRRSHPQVQSDHFHLILEALPFSDWESLVSQLSDGRLQTKHGDIEASAVQDVNTRLGFAGRNLGILAKMDPDWPHCDISWERQWNPQVLSRAYALVHDERLSAELSRTGYSNAREVIDAFCEFQSSWDRNNLALYISIPIPALIESVTLDPVAATVNAMVKYREDVQPVSCYVVLKHSPANTGLIPKKLTPGDLDVVVEDGGIISSRATACLPHWQEGDFVEVRLMVASGEADSYQRTVEELVPAAQINPVHQTLLVFRDQEALISDLTRPQSRTLPKRPQPWQHADYYERSVAWTLSCLGFQCVMLGEHEKLKDPVSGVELGTIDLLAFEKNSGVFLLVACSMGTPKEEDLNRLVHVRQVIWERVFSGTDLSLIPIVFTGTKYPEYWSPMISESVFSVPERVPVVDLERSRQLITLFATRQEKRFLQFVNDPQIGL